MNQPRWLEIAWAELGQREVSGKSDNARILAFFRDAGHPGIKHDETAWCAAFVGACIARAGLKASGSLMARSYLAWGVDAQSPALGAVAVLPRGSDPAAGHVGFVVGATADSIFLLGGNQDDAVSVARFSRSSALGFRLPLPGEVSSGDRTAGSSRLPSDRYYANALAHVLEMEGGWSEDPYDPGGPTNRGITLETYASYRGVRLDAGTFGSLRQELKKIDEATVNEIYRRRYWEPSRAAELPAGLALMHFDAAVNHGVGAAARTLQEVCGVHVDGEIGPLTLAAAIDADEREALRIYAEARRRRYRALPHFWRFGRGWLSRVEKTLAKATRLIASPPLASTTKGTTAMSEPNGNSAGEGSAAQDPAAADAKWWGESMTIWRAALTALTTVVPVVAPLMGFDITGEMVRQLGDQAVKAVQAVGGLVGTLLTIWGRARASTRIERRQMLVRL